MARVDNGLVPHRVYHNQNYHVPGEEKPLESYAFSGKKWASANIKAGKETAAYVEISWLVDAVKNYFGCFLDPENNPLVSGITKILGACSGFLDGKRDQIIYRDIYARGLTQVTEGNVTNRQILNQQATAEQVSFLDDFMENKLIDVKDEHQNERLIPKFWQWATNAATIEPIVSLITPFLGTSWGNAVDSAIQIPGRGLWRLRFLPGALHSNFVSSVWDLCALKAKSFFSTAAAQQYSKKVEQLQDMSHSYFENKYRGSYNIAGKNGLGLYVRMLTDRMKEHWDGMWNPEKALEQKVRDGFLKSTTQEERELNRDRTIDKGFVSVDDNGKINSKADIHHQWRLSVTDFTGPICGVLGLVGTFIFDPLRIGWNLMGINKGKYLINALSASRKSFSLFNYLFRFINTEVEQGHKYKALESLMTPKDGQPPPNKALREMYYARKARYMNGIVARLISLGNIAEPVLHLLNPLFEESKFGNFFFKMFVKFNDNGFLRLFSKRRECMGRIEEINSLLREKVQNRQINDNDLLLISDEEFDRAVNERYSRVDGVSPGAVDPYLSKITGVYHQVKRAFAGVNEDMDLATLGNA